MCPPTAHLSFIFATSNKNYGTMYKTAEEKKRILQHIQGWAELTANKANEMLRLLQATFSKEELEEFKSNELDLKDDLIQTLAYLCGIQWTIDGIEEIDY